MLWQFEVRQAGAFLDDIVQMFLHELSGSGKKLLIFDEIQNIPQWDKLIRTLYEKEREIESSFL